MTQLCDLEPGPFGFGKSKMHASMKQFAHNECQEVQSLLKLTAWRV